MPDSNRAPAETPPPQLDQLGRALHRSLSANRYQEAREYAARCVELRTPENHAAVMSILQRARQIAMVQRTRTAARLDSLRGASEYLRNSSNR